MASEERARHQLYDDLGRILPPESVETLMDHLPPTGWADVARRQDLDHVVAMLRGEMDQLRSELRAEISDLRADLHASLASQTRWFLGALIAMTAVLSSLMVALR